ncbi:XRE family transcriptional regulator [Pseudoflavonifractor sp. 524-17]|uniref:helix-turn-helix domain-containing protein n=1 Tax=Pseudoflavonifractor sp. 524-17 TaxID=2304577 RepID=UPI00137A9695|nr:helix-turn-helix transcriptional regulator [Pseudoflavonifractor sp. 524-17]NCE63064.1 XRE family transcriptional regulator [Pseudoflavonifractor sp. 524-17]
MKMLRATRKSKGLTMKELGEKVGVSESAISQYETGKREADFETLLKIGEVLDCSIDYLLRGEEQKKKPAPTDGDGLDDMDRCLLGFIQAMTPDQKQLLLAQMQVLFEQGK